MRVGILTQPLRDNYGGLLQNYALQKVLQNLGHEPYTVDWYPPTPAFTLKGWLWKKKEQLLGLVHNNRQQFRYKPTKDEKAIISRNTSKFIQRNINVCPSFVSHHEDFFKTDERFLYDAYVVGSDQVWRPLYNYFQASMFLDFVKRENVKRIAYAASFGIADWEFSQELTETCSVLAKRFDLITVREKSGIELCKEHLGIEAYQVLDPTMLLSREDYEKLIGEENEPQSSGALFHYILDPSKEKRLLIEEVAKDIGLKPFTIMPKCQAENRTRGDVKHRIEDCVFPSVTSWLRGFMDAEMIIVDSFHGAVFSIIFNKPFWVLSNAERGNARFESLLTLYGLEDRMVSLNNMSGVDWQRKIDWQRVNKIREKEKERCVSLLKHALICNKKFN